MINGNCLLNAIISATNNIKNNRELVDKLNIFPVPDGDTGTNMSMTMSAACAELKKLEGDFFAEQIAKTTASALLRGARGNSGVILSLLFKGFSEGLKDIKEASAKNLLDALSIGVNAAYKAVMKPMEGTILTVARVAFEKGTDVLFFNDDPVFVWEAVCNGAREALATTPELLPVLKKAGVVDAGGQGLCLIFEGMLSVFKNGTIIKENKEITSNNSNSSNSIFENAIAMFDEDIKFTYCTEFIVGRNKEVLTQPSEARTYLESIGDCVVVVDDEEIIKVHVHTENPGLALQEGLKYGQLLTVKVENMREQNRLAKESSTAPTIQKAKLEKQEPVENVGFVSVAAGNGLQDLFSDLGCNHVVSGGQTMNPSTEDILEACLATPAKAVFILPNNKNIIMAAEQVKDLVTDREIIVVPTKTIPQGMTAMLSFDPELSVEENFSAMVKGAADVKTGQVTFASRDAEFGGLKIKEGEILALSDGKLTHKAKDPVKAAIRLLHSIANHHTSFITIIQGEGVSDVEAKTVFDAAETKFGSHAEVTLVNGGQPIYHFILAIE